MSLLRLPGLLTGIDTASLIEQLMALERRSLTVYESRKETWEEKRDALDTLETKLTNLRSTARTLSDADELKAFNVSSSDSDILTASANYNAFEGTHTVVINQLANAERWVHSAGEEYAEDYVGAGTFIYSYNHKETSVTTTATTSLSDLVGLINNDADNPGVTASLLYYNDAYHLVLNGNDAGSDYAVKINLGTTQVYKSTSEFTKGNENATLNTKITDLDQFGTPLEEVPVEHIDITGADHFGVAIDPAVLNVTANTTIGHLVSEINDAFDGRAKAVFENGKIILTDSEDGSSSLSITLTWDADGGSTSLSNLTMTETTEGLDNQADLTNFAPTDFTLSQASQDSKIKVDGFPNTSAVPEVQTVTLATAPDNVPDGGTFTLTYRGETTENINWNDNAATIQTKLEALSTVNSNDITVSGAIAHNATFTFASSLGNVDLLMINSSLTDGGIGVTASIAETTPGSDGYISKSSNTIDDVIYGTTLHLHDTTDANGEEITLTRDTESVKKMLSSMVDSYNLAINFIQEKSGYNDILKTGGVLMGDYVVSTIKYQLTNPIISQVAGFVNDIDTFLLPAHIGIELDSDGLLNFDKNIFDEAIGDDYLGVLDIIGADKTGSSNSDNIEFYGASSRNTDAGEYTIRATYDGAGDLDKVEFKLSSEDASAYREGTILGNVATGNSTFDSSGNPVYSEHSLQVTVPETSTPSSTMTATVWVKQGFTGTIEDALDKMLKAVSGTIQIDQEHAKDQIDELVDKIELEEYRLGLREDRLINKFARLEKALALMQNQMAGLGLSMG
jgi:flagellar capping protein FliD